MSIQQNFPSTRPSLNLNFARSKTLDPRITFTRTSTATYVGEDGLIKTAPANSPRFDHDPVTGECLGLLIEEQRENLLTRSEDIINWGQPNNITALENQTISPDGTNNATKLIEDATNSTHVAWRGSTNTAGDIICGSVFVKAAERTNVSIGFPSGGKGIRFNFNDESIGFPNVPGWSTSNVYGVIKYPNGWYRIWIQTTASGDGTVDSFRIFTHNGTTTSYLGDGVSGIFVWGAQVEKGSFPTSYIPTTTSTATRTPDNAKIEGSNFSSWFNNNEFSIFTHHKFPSVPPNYYPRVFDINTGSDAYRLNHYHDPSIYGTKIGCSVVENSVTQYAVSTSSYDIGDDLRMASCFKDNDFASYVNGALVGTDNTGVFSTTQRTVLYIGSSVNGSSPINGTISQFTYYPVRLPNNQLINLTK